MSSDDSSDDSIGRLLDRLPIGEWVNLTKLGLRVKRLPDQADQIITPGFDHEHPCPSSGCVEQLRRLGHDVGDNIICCVCWKQANGVADHG